MIDEKRARSYCSEVLSLIENYKEAVADKNEIWDIHHRREIDEGLSKKELIKKGEYFQRHASELIFLKHDEHARLHGLGKHHSEETRKKMSKAQSGEKNHFFGKHLSEEHKKKLSLANSGEKHYFFGRHLSEETKKKLSQALSGKKCSEEHKKKLSLANLGKHRSEETRKKMSEYHWYNNGVETIKAKSCPEGFTEGRLPFKRESQHSV